MEREETGLVVLETVCVAFAMFSALPVPHVAFASSAYLEFF